jgi:hypothetical protein
MDNILIEDIKEISEETWINDAPIDDTEITSDTIEQEDAISIMELETESIKQAREWEIDTIELPSHLPSLQQIIHTIKSSPWEKQIRIWERILWISNNAYNEIQKILSSTIL